MLTFVLLSVLLTLVGGWGLYRSYRHIRLQSRLAFLAYTPLPDGVRQRWRARYPALSPQQAARVEQGLQQFFRLFARNNKQALAMPSHAVDALWHEFILDTRTYQAFCQQAFGRFLHHTPTDSSNRKQQQAMLRHSWYGACHDEDLAWQQPARLPLLFALDHELGLADAFDPGLLFPPAAPASDSLYGGAESSGDGGDGGSDSSCSSCSGCGGD